MLKRREECYTHHCSMVKEYVTAVVDVAVAAVVTLFDASFLVVGCDEGMLLEERHLQNHVLDRNHNLFSFSLKEYSICT